MSEKSGDKTLSLQVRERLRSEILQNKLPAGTRITMKNIAERYGVSRMPVREAMQALSGENLLEFSPYKGATVLPLDKNYIAYCNDLLAAIQMIFAPDFVKNWNEKIGGELKELNSRYMTLCDNESILASYREINDEFHEKLHSLSSNKLAVEAYAKYRELLQDIRMAYTVTPERIKEITAEHDEILFAAAAGDVKLVEVTLFRHSMNSKKDILSFAERSL